MRGSAKEGICEGNKKNYHPNFSSLLRLSTFSHFLFRDNLAHSLWLIGLDQYCTRVLFKENLHTTNVFFLCKPDLFEQSYPG